MRLQQLWSKARLIGVYDTMPDDLRRRIELTNQIAFTGLLISLPFAILNYRETAFAALFLVLWIFMGTVLLLNHLRFHNLSRLLFVLSNLGVVFCMEVFTYFGHEDAKSGLRYLQFAFISFPLVIFSFQKEKVQIFVCLAVALVLLLINRWADEHIELIESKFLTFEILQVQNNFVVAAAVLILTLSFRYYQNITAKAEAAIAKLLAETQDKNEQLIAQEEEIRQYADELYAINDHLNSTLTEVNRQKEVIEHKNNDILESIVYARRIQMAILPAPEIIKMAFPSSFIFFKPKDIVSGDFYWFTQVQDKLCIAAVDCTGHGVPGAFMSVMGYNLLNQIVNELEITSPDVILSELDRRIKFALNQQGNAADSKDGMDLSMCIFNTTTKTVEIAAAYRPVYLVRNGEIITVAPSKFSIGGGQVLNKEFTSQTIEIQPKDRFYLFSDGITDQFGGEAGRKFTPKRFQQFLAGTANLTLPQQHAELNQLFTNWRGNHPQLDDVMVIGIEPFAPTYVVDGLIP